MMKRLALISDLSGFGNCSLSAAMPIVSAYGILPCPMPTAVFSRQTGFDSYFHRSLTEEMREISADWDGEHFDGIYTGYFVSAEQLGIAEDFMDNHPEATVRLVDPILGDDGARYDTVDDALVESFRKLIRNATVTTPNVTELAILTDRDLSHPMSDEQIETAARSLLGDVCRTVIVTGIHRNGRVFNRIFTENEAVSEIGSKFIPGSFSGTGDIFSSVVASRLILGDSGPIAVKRAVKQIDRMLKFAKNDPTDPRYGLPISIK